MSIMSIKTEISFSQSQYPSILVVQIYQPKHLLSAMIILQYSSRYFSEYWPLCEDSSAKVVAMLKHKHMDKKLTFCLLHFIFFVFNCVPHVTYVPES